MFRQSTPLVSLVLAAALVTQGCGGYSENHRRGLALAGGASAFMGMIMVGDGLSCDTNFGGDNGTEDCNEDKADLISGGLMIGAGAVLIGLAYLFQPKDGEASAAAPVAKGKK
jgi:hypothetical protein